MAPQLAQNLEIDKWSDPQCTGRPYNSGESNRSFSKRQTQNKLQNRFPDP